MTASNLSVWTEGRDAAARGQPPIRGAFLSAAAELRRRLDETATAIRRGEVVDVLALDRVLPLEAFGERLRDAMHEGLVRAFRASARATSRRVGKQDLLGPALSLPATMEEELAAAWIEERGAALVTSVTRRTRDAVRGVIFDGVRRNLGALEIVAEVRQIIGLSERDAQAILRFRERAIARGVAAGALERETERRRSRMLRARAETIARTETIAARNAGTVRTWAVRQAEGELPPTGLGKAWIVNAPCEICQAIADEPPVPLGQPFFSPLQGEWHDHPPAHPRCRCSVGMVEL